MMKEKLGIDATDALVKKTIENEPFASCLREFYSSVEKGKNVALSAQDEKRLSALLEIEHLVDEDFGFMKKYL